MTVTTQAWIAAVWSSVTGRPDSAARVAAVNRIGATGLAAIALLTVVRRVVST